MLGWGYVRGGFWELCIPRVNIIVCELSERYKWAGFSASELAIYKPRFSLLIDSSSSCCPGPQTARGTRAITGSCGVVGVQAIGRRFAMLRCCHLSAVFLLLVGFVLEGKLLSCTLVPIIQYVAF